VAIIRVPDAVKARLEHMAGQDYSIGDVVAVLLERTVPDESRMREGQTQIGFFDRLVGRSELLREKRRKGGAKVSYICQECGTQYGDPELDAIPIICSECVDNDLDADTDIDTEGSDEE
jgi:hypothetical protein